MLVAEDTEIGYKVIINNTHWGLVYHNEVFQRLEKGEHLKGYIKEVRKDEKIDVSLTPLRISKGRRCCQDNSGFAQSSRKICSQ